MRLALLRGGGCCCDCCVGVGRIVDGPLVLPNGLIGCFGIVFELLTPVLVITVFDAVDVVDVVDVVGAPLMARLIAAWTLVSRIRVA